MSQRCSPSRLSGPPRRGRRPLRTRRTADSGAVGAWMAVGAPRAALGAAAVQTAPAAAGSAQQRLERALKPAIADDLDLERQPERSRGPLGRRARRRGGALREPEHAGVVAEVLFAQLRVAVQPQLAPDRAIESARQEVGEQVGAGLLAKRLERLLAGEGLVAVGGGEALDPCALQHAVDRAAA